jgi:peptidoglycan/xylan/chitin deacetylase (PgdA/CDA1 family)
LPQVTPGPAPRIGPSPRIGAAAAVGLAAAAQWVPSVVSLGQWLPVRALPGGVCRWRTPATDSVALTFDDGPDPAGTPVLLDALDRLGLVATFFCLGQHAARYPELVGEIRRRGHAVGTHGYAHEHHLLRGPRWVAKDIDAALEAMAAAGVSPRWYRPPYGQASGPTLLAARRRGLGTVLWSGWGREWAAPDAGAVAARIRPALVAGAIVLLHDSDAFSPPGSAARTLAALEDVAGVLEARGLGTATLDEAVAP